MRLFSPSSIVAALAAIAACVPADRPLPTEQSSSAAARGRLLANLINALAGHPLSDLIDQIEAGNAYANVHTNDGVGATNTGPGDFPGGEIRGQVRVH